MAAAAVTALCVVPALALPFDSGAAVTAKRSIASGIAASEKPTPGALYKDGPGGRYLFGGTWLFRFDGGVGLSDRFEDERSSAGWKQISVPNAWNAGQQSAASYQPNVGWYRKDFVLPSSAPQYTWIVRFESVNNEVAVWLNGHRIATHSGAFLAFEVVLPSADLHRSGVNRLVLRVSDAHTTTSLPPVSQAGPKGIVGGWWNYGGVLREVYLRRVQTVDFASVLVLAHLGCATCAARITYSVAIRNYAAAPQQVRVSTRFGAIAASLGEHTIAPGASATFTAALAVSHPRLWSPASPQLYTVTLDASAGPPGTALLPRANYLLQSGIRAVSVVGGQLYLNYQPLHLRGVGLVEDSPTEGAAVSPALQAKFIEDAKALGATIIRSQYPLSAYEEQLADQLGIMLWSEIPAYQVLDTRLAAVTGAATAMLRENILENGNHPSIIIWSIANELDPLVGPAQTAYIAAAVRAARALDPTRPVGLAYEGYPAVGCQSGYAPLQVLGINDYFGWYPGPSGEIADPSLLGDYLAKERACYPHKALMVTEFGAEANRSGPVDERGTYQFQSQFITNQLAAFAAVPSLSGAIYWALQDFLVRPGWTGGNPYPTPPLFTKGLVGFNGIPKPAWAVVQQAYQSTKQVG